MAAPTTAPRRIPAKPAFWEMAPLVGALEAVDDLVAEEVVDVVEVVRTRWVLVAEVTAVVWGEPARGAELCPAI